MSTSASPSTTCMPRRWVAPHLLLLVALLASLALLPEVAAQPSSIVVTTANQGVAGGDGCSLREAILNANADDQSGSVECLAGSGPDLITFDGDYTITLASTLPNLTSQLTIDGAGHSITISGNHAVQVLSIGGSGVVTLSNLSVINGRSADYGGGIVNSGTLTVNNSILSGNSADILGGGIQSDGTVTISTSTFNGNSAPLGGGIQNSGTLTISTSTFSANSAAGSGDSGGGIDSSGGSMLTISSSTFSGNSAYFGGGIAIRGATLTLSNSLIANSPSGGDCSNIGTIATNRNNLIEDGSCSPALSGDPLLSPLGSYGGTTQTFALLPGSPAIDAGDSTACAEPLLNNQDQRGLARSVGSSCDIGAFESRGFSLGSLSGTPQSAAVNSAFATPLGLTVSSAFGEPVGPGGRVNFSSPISGPSVSFAPTSIANTNVAGVVSLPVTANGLAGKYRVMASSQGVSGVARFDLTNLKFIYVPMMR